MTAPKSGQGNNTTNGNPLKFDPELRGLLDKLDLVSTFKSFKRWKNSFLNRFETFLEQEGINKADEAYGDFSFQMQTFVKNYLVKVEASVERGDLTNEKVTVKGRNSLNEMCKMLDNTIKETEALIPSTGADEQKRGFTKYQLGAVLVKDGFEEYERMKYVNDVLQLLGTEKLGDVADKQQIEQFNLYGTQLQRFCDVMADLGLYEVMLKCREFAEEPEEEPDNLIFIDMKTASVFELDREDSIEAGLVTFSKKDGAAPGSFAEATRDNSSERDDLIKKLKTHPTLGVATQLVVEKTVTDFGELEIAEADKVKNLWGVSLKKRPKNVKGEEFMFLDPESGAIGEVSRSNAIKNEAIHVITNEFNKQSLAEAEEGAEERETIIVTIRSVLGIKMEDK